MPNLKLELRKVHKRKAGGELGTIAELHELLVKRGYSYLLRKGKPYFETGKAIYEDPRGTKAIMQRVEKGKPPIWTGRRVGLVRTAPTADLWQLIMSKEKK